MPESPARSQCLLDFRVGIEDAHSRKHAHVVREMPARVDRGVDVQAITHARVEVVGAVTRRGMHRTGSLFQRDVLPEYGHRISIVERVSETEPFQLPPLERGDSFLERTADLLTNLPRQLVGDDDRGAV